MIDYILYDLSSGHDNTVSINTVLKKKNMKTEQ